MWRLPLPVRLVDKDVVSKTRGRLEVFADGKWELSATTGRTVLAIRF